MIIIIKMFFEKLNFYFSKKAKLVTLCHHLGKARVNTRFAEMVTKCHKFGFLHSPALAQNPSLQTLLFELIVVLFRLLLF